MALEQRRGLDPVLRHRLFLLAQRAHALASAVLLAVGAALLLFLFLHWPEISQAHSRAVAQFETELANQDVLYCEKWGLKPGTHEHTVCTLDLKQLRSDYENRLANDTAGIL